MVRNFFLTYIGVFFACSVLLAAIVKQFASGFASQGKKPYVYGTLSSLVVSGTAYLSTLISDHLFSVFWFLACIYLLFGIIHIVLVHKKYFSAGKEDKIKVIVGEIIFGLSIILFTIVVFSALQYFLAEKTNYLFYPVLMSTLAFFVPFLFMQTFEAAFIIPSAIFKTWQYPLHEPIDVPEENPREKLLVIGFEIAKKPTDKTKTPFRAKTPEGMNLGELYYHFINDYNEAQSETPIEFAKDGNDAYEWWFRRKPKWYQRQRILDPGISVRGNGIIENTVIICERLDNKMQS